MLRVALMSMYEDTSEERNPERNLLLALVERVFRDLTSPSNRERQDAAYWVLHTGEDYFFSFDSVVQLLNWESEIVERIEKLAHAACGDFSPMQFGARTSGGRQRSITDENEAQIRESWGRGWTILMICDEFKIGQNAVRAYLKKHNLYMRRHPNAKIKKEN